ncbi:MAG TPA: right-handed parallel beta-helix repeat-containing protein [Candidatus Thermoplasmatota archaeon]|nr:right-handed parallel beta-helix repeat-containing protein [Candidatus Thermoplasmatota archaeon]
MRALPPLLGLLLLPILAAPAAQADVGVVLVVAGERTFADGEFTFRHHVVVPPGATLILRNATVWLDAGRLCTDRPLDRVSTSCVPQLEVLGTLIVENSTLDTRNWARGQGFILHVDRGVARITDSTLRHYTGVTFYQQGLAPSVVERNVFTEGVSGVRFVLGVQASFRGNLMTHLREGVEVSDSEVAIEDNVFRDLAHGGGASGRAIWLRSAAPQDEVVANAGPVRRNLIENATVGISVSTGRANVVEDNVIRGGEAGMVLVAVQDTRTMDRDPPVVRRNLVDGARIGIRVSGNEAGSVGPVRTAPPTDVGIPLSGNAIVGFTCHGIQVTTIPADIRIAVDATHVWWGDGRGPLAVAARAPRVAPAAPPRGPVGRLSRAARQPGRERRRPMRLKPKAAMTAATASAT